MSMAYDILKKPVVFLDVETTGLDCDKNQIIEIGLVRRERDGKYLAGQLIDPGIPLPYEIKRLTGLNDDILKGNPDQDAAMRRIAPLLADNPVIVAHNAVFDLGFLIKGLEKICISWDGDYLCTNLLGYYAIPDAPNYKLDTICSILGIERKVSHRAYEDALVCEKAFVQLLPEVQKDKGYIPFNETLWWEGRDSYEPRKSKRIYR